MKQRKKSGIRRRMPGNGNALFFAAGEMRTVAAGRGVKAALKIADKAAASGGTGGGFRSGVKHLRQDPESTAYALPPTGYGRFAPHAASAVIVRRSLAAGELRRERSVSSMERLIAHIIRTHGTN